ncbi:class I SAM-dependent methyltransferase [Microlunatus aurantiacus]|uniref:Class I SAM-dependent methyltransferase n=1 Tax=Microlunatus aurantiacus TaxID=446786 RepID=A0ABP7E4P8_9ACTN
MTQTMIDDAALKARHRAMWALGDYTAVATEVIADLGPRLVAAVGVRPGERLLDVAAGAGNVALPAARAGARVTASDLTPELLERGRVVATNEGLDIAWETADAEALPYGDDSFEVTTSCVGVMFAPHHQPAADELLRVTRAGGRIGLISWTPTGFIGQMFATMKPYAPPPPAGASPAPLWGEESHVRELWGDRVRDLRARRERLPISHFRSPEEFRDYFKINYGPTIAVYRSLADQPERQAALDRDLLELARGAATGRDEGMIMEWEYLLVTAVVV